MTLTVSGSDDPLHAYRLCNGLYRDAEEMDDNLYLKRGAARTKALARSFRITKEIVAANVYNRALTSGYTGGDGVVLFRPRIRPKAATRATRSQLLRTCRKQALMIWQSRSAMRSMHAASRSA